MSARTTFSVDHNSARQFPQVRLPRIGQRIVQNSARGGAGDVRAKVQELPMQDVNGVATLNRRTAPRLAAQGPRPKLRCAVVIESLPLFSEGLVRLLEGLADFRTISTSATTANLRTLLARLRPELVMLDLDAHDSRPIDAVRLVQRHTRGTKLIFLSAGFSPQAVPMLLRAGASAVLLKSANADDVRQTVLGVLQTRAARQSVAARAPARIDVGSSEPQPLTQREREILTYVALGFSVKRTADTLGLSPKTIESHRTRLMAKLHIHDRVMLTHYALQLGIVPQMSLPASGVRPAARSRTRNRAL